MANIKVNDFFKTARSLIDSVKKRGKFERVGLKDAANKASSIEKTTFDWSALGYDKEPEQIGEGYAAAVSVLNNGAYSGNAQLMFMPNITLPSTLTIQNCPRLFAFSKMLDFSTVKRLTISSCPSLKSLQLSGTGKVFKPNYLSVSDNKNLSDIDLGDIDMSECTSLTLGPNCKIDFKQGVLNWDVSNLTYLRLHFNGSCPSVLDLSANNGKWTPSKLTSLIAIAVPSGTEIVRLQNWGDTIQTCRASGNDGWSAFRYCFARKIDVTGTSFKNCTNFSNLFNVNMVVEEVIGEIDMDKATNVGDMFFQYRQNGDLRITEIRLKNVGVSLDMGRCNSLSPESIHYLIQNAKKTDNGITFTFCNRDRSSSSSYSKWAASEYFEPDSDTARDKNISITYTT